MVRLQGRLERLTRARRELKMAACFRPTDPAQQAELLEENKADILTCRARLLVMTLPFGSLPAEGRHAEPPEGRGARPLAPKKRAPAPKKRAKKRAKAPPYEWEHVVPDVPGFWCSLCGRHLRTTRPRRHAEARGHKRLEQARAGDARAGDARAGDARAEDV